MFSLGPTVSRDGIEAGLMWVMVNCARPASHFSHSNLKAHATTSPWVGLAYDYQTRPSDNFGSDFMVISCFIKWKWKSPSTMNSPYPGIPTHDVTCCLLKFLNFKFLHLHFWILVIRKVSYDLWASKNSTMYGNSGIFHIWIPRIPAKKSGPIIIGSGGGSLPI